MDEAFDNEIKKIGYRIKKYRVIRHLKQHELAEQVDVSLEQIQKIEQGRGAPRLKTLLKISAALDVTPGSVLSDDSQAEDEDIILLLDRYRHLSNHGRQSLLAITGELFKLESNLRGG